MQDQVCLKFDDICLQPFRWLMVVEQNGIPPQVDGIVGLTQGNTISEEDQVDFPYDYEIGPLYLDNLSKAGWITEKSFSTHFEEGNSYIDFGPVNYRSMSSIEEYVEIAFQKGFFYSIYPQAIRFGNELST